MFPDLAGEEGDGWKRDSGLAKWQRKFVHSSREKVLIVDLRFMEEVAQGSVRELCPPLSPVPPSPPLELR